MDAAIVGIQEKADVPHSAGLVVVAIVLYLRPYQFVVTELGPPPASVLLLADRHGLVPRHSPIDRRIDNQAGPLLMDAFRKDIFLKSLERCGQNATFISSFYDRFLSTSEDIREKFKHTDFDKQNQMLLKSLKLVAGATLGEPASLREMRERAETHDRHNLNIEPRLYDFWLDSAIETASEFDTEWDESVEQAWHAVLGYVILHMAKFY